MMKSQLSRRKNGFTLVELLVVIAIIAVLAGLATPMALNALEKGKKISALATCTAIESAVNNFYTEYGGLPTSQTQDEPAVNTTDAGSIDFLNILLGLKETADPPMNTRAIKFLTAKDGKAKKDGLIYDQRSVAHVRGLYDPWGGPYMVMMDADYNGELKVQPAASTKSVTLHNRRVAVWSNGADCTNGGKGAKGKTIDDVKTW